MASANDPVLPPEEAERLVKVAGLLASDQEGERATAALLGTRLLERYGLRWADVIAARRLPAPGVDAARPSPPQSPTEHRRHEEMLEGIAFLVEHIEHLQGWPLRFVTDLHNNPPAKFSPLQQKKLIELVLRVQGIVWGGRT